MEEFNIENRYPEYDTIVNLKKYELKMEENKVINLSDMEDNDKRYLLGEYFFQIIAYDYGGYFYPDVVQIDVNLLELLPLSPLSMRKRIENLFLMGYKMRRDYIIDYYKFIGWCKIDDTLLEFLTPKSLFEIDDILYENIKNEKGNIRLIMSFDSI